MKLKNKKTREIGYLIDVRGVEHYVVDKYGYDRYGKYDSLAKLNEEWEDYEGPKEYYAIDLQGDAIKWARHSWDEKTTNKIKEIGNYFETREEAELALRKLKAWKRLKDKGFRFDGYDVANRGGDNVICGQVYFKAGNYDREEIVADLDLLFGGKE